MVYFAFYGLKRVSFPKKFSALFSNIQLLHPTADIGFGILCTNFYGYSAVQNPTHNSYHNTNCEQLLHAAKKEQGNAVVSGYPGEGYIRSGRVQLPVLWSMPEHDLC